MKEAGLRESTTIQSPRLSDIPGKRAWPIVGNIFSLMSDLPNFTRRRYERFGAISRIRMGIKTVVLVLGADLAREILLDKDRRFSSELGYEFFLPIYGRGLLQYDFEEHRYQRRIFQSAFKIDAMREYVRILATTTEQQTADWRNMKNFRFFPNIKELMLRSALVVFYGAHESPAEISRLSKAFIDTAQGLLRIFDADLPGFRMHRAKRGRKLLRAYIGALIPERRTGAGKDTLSYICRETKEDGEYFTETEIIDHAGFLLFAAHDTTTSLLLFMIYYLAANPQWQNKLRAEIGNRDVRDLSYEDLQAMTVMGWVMDEVLRLAPPGAVFARRTLQAVKLNNVTIPHNTDVVVIPAFNHRDPGAWLNPDSFDPLRFSPERCEHKNIPYDFIPFGGGAHKCIGMYFARMQAALFMSHFLTRYSFFTAKDYRPKFQYLPTPRILGDLPLTLVPI